ncbi:hypothetical protein AADZ91_17735 [Colwelliaceae bacterium 6441]
MRNKAVNDIEIENGAPIVPPWRIWGLRLFFAGMVFILGKIQLQYILEGPSEWSSWRGLGHSMLFALALFAVGGGISSVSIFTHHDF